MLHEVGRTEEHTSQSLFNLSIADPYPLAQNQDLKIFPDSLLTFSPPQDKMILYKEHIHLFPEGPELEGRIGKLLKIFNHSGPFGVPIDVAHTSQVVFIRVDDARPVTIAPQVSGASDMFVVPDGDPGVEILHGPVKILLRSGGDDVVVVGHEHDVMDENVIFFMGFLECLEYDARDLPFVESERSIVCPTDQVVG